MLSNAEFRVEGRRLIAAVSGTFDLEEAVRRFERVTLACRLQGLTDVLIDSRALGGQGWAVPEIIYAERIATLYRSHLQQGGSPFRTAYVGSDEAIGSDGSPGEEVMKEEGVDVYVTTEMDAALAWLDAC